MVIEKLYKANVSEQAYHFIEASFDQSPTEPSFGNDSISVKLARRDSHSTDVTVTFRVDPVGPNNIALYVDFGDNASARVTPQKDGTVMFQGRESDLERFKEMKPALQVGVESLRRAAQGRMIWSSVLHTLQKEVHHVPAAV